MSELKPCAHCGGEASFDIFDSEYGLHKWIKCLTCNASSDSAEVEDDEDTNSDKLLAGKWNRRASPWIRFEDRKPEEGQVCVFYWIDSDDLETWKYRKSGMSQNRPSHWMSIPEVEEV